MAREWFKDMQDMHDKYGVKEAVRKMTPEMRKQFLEFRLDFLQEELDESRKALEEDDASEVVDGMIDLCVVASGTLEAFDVDGDLAWERVWNANMSKEVGVKEGRPNPLGLPDLIKPEGWEAPYHHDNTGKILK